MNDTSLLKKFLKIPFCLYLYYNFQGVKYSYRMVKGRVNIVCTTKNGSDSVWKLSYTVIFSGE